MGQSRSGILLVLPKEPGETLKRKWLPLTAFAEARRNNGAASQTARSDNDGTHAAHSQVLPSHQIVPFVCHVTVRSTDAGIPSRECKSQHSRSDNKLHTSADTNACDYLAL